MKTTSFEMAFIIRDFMQERLQKIIALRGGVSRRGAEELIAKGLVRVNGKPVKLGDKADVEKTIAAIEAAGEKAFLIGETKAGEKGVELC